MTYSFCNGPESTFGSISSCASQLLHQMEHRLVYVRWRTDQDGTNTAGGQIDNTDSRTNDPVVLLHSNPNLNSKCSHFGKWICFVCKYRVLRKMVFLRMRWCKWICMRREEKSGGEGVCGCLKYINENNKRIKCERGVAIRTLVNSSPGNKCYCVRPKWRSTFASGWISSNHEIHLASYLPSFFCVRVPVPASLPAWYRCATAKFEQTR